MRAVGGRRKPAGIRLTGRPVEAEKAWILSGLSPPTMKEPFGWSAISSTSAHATQREPMPRPAAARGAICVDRPKLKDSSHSWSPESRARRAREASAAVSMGSGGGAHAQAAGAGAKAARLLLEGCGAGRQPVGRMCIPCVFPFS